MDHFDRDSISTGVNIIYQKMLDAFKYCVSADLSLHAFFYGLKHIAFIFNFPMTIIKFSLIRAGRS